MFKSDVKLARGVTFFLVFAAGLVTGLMMNRLWTGNDKKSDTPVEIHEPGYRLINPLLECEGAAETIGDRELRPFQSKIEALVKEIKQDGRASHVSVYFRDLNNGPWFSIDAEERFSPASLLKVPVMIACLKQAESDPGILKKKIKYNGGGDLDTVMNIKGWKSIEPGKSYTVDDLLSLMIEYSDNNAKELLRRNMDPEFLAKTYTDLGVHMPLVETDDFMTVRSYASFFRVLYNASYLSKEMSHKALTYLAESDYKEGLVAGVPSTTIVAHKFGERGIGNTGVVQLHDCGIVYYPDSPYLLCIMSRGNDFKMLSDTIRDISRLVYQEVDAQEQANNASGQADLR